MICINGRFLTQDLSGSQRFAYEIVKGLLSKPEFKITIFVPPLKINSQFDVTTFNLKVIGRNTSLLWEQLDLPLYLKKNKSPLLVNLINTAPLIYKNQIVTIHDMTTFINPKWFNTFFSYYYQLIIPIIAKRSLKVITVSENSKRDIIQFLNIPESKIIILYNGISRKFLEDVDITSSNSNFLKKFNIKPTEFILAVSSLDPRKNFKRLIKAYTSTGLAIPLVIVGTKGKVFADDGIKQLILNKKNIVFTGHISDNDLAKLYCTAKCFIYPSLYEGFGIPPLEAMACGCATIVSNTSSMPEVCGSASLYVDPLNVESIKASILKLTEDDNLRKNLIKKGFEQIKKYSWERSNQKLIKLIEEST